MSMTADPESLLALARAGEGAALGQLLEQHRGYLALLARLQIGRRLQGKVDASDLVQETFLEAHRNFGLFRGSNETAFVGWLRQILATNLAQSCRHYFGTQRRDVRLERETVWLSFEQQRKADVAKNATTASDGKTYRTMVLERRPV